ncbi:hypothetical protein [Nocardioides abyssi]|uniref:ESX-1 secretion-associated protein n=1 Tax=Nocardioides abyssi TaxID=3058370 RepID=A0ABT8EWE8_9ACTN|nr:hypothetical protein [Nocardioides abyssi]MDN4162508.1 hypothetical protein [Nocardioides abyssi]
MGELQIDIPRLYRAGKVDVPEEAAHLAEISADLFDALGTFNVMTAQAGDPAAWRRLLKVGGEVYEEIRETVLDLNNIGVALIKTADHFVETDADARRQYDGMGRHLKDVDPRPADVPPEMDSFHEPGANDSEGSRIESTPDPTEPTLPEAVS